MLGNWGIARPYNFLLLPMVDPLFGYAFDRRANEKILLGCAFSSKQEEWFDLECVDVHDGKRYKMVNCKENAEIAHNVVFPSQFARLLVEYQEHPEAKSLCNDRIGWPDYFVDRHADLGHVLRQATFSQGHCLR
jgi:hypothetical protein